MITALHRTLFAAGVVITSYRVTTTAEGLHERMELASIDGKELNTEQSEQVRSLSLPLAWEDDSVSNSQK